MFDSPKGLDRLSVPATGSRIFLAIALTMCHALNPVAAQTSSQPAVPHTPPAFSAATADVGTTAALPLLRDAHQMAAVLGGIMSYTRWPLTANPIRLCVLGHEGLVEQFRMPVAALGQRAVVAQGVKLDADFLHDCDAMYVTAIPPENSRVMLRRVVGSPILTVGEGAEFCSDGGMFCLNASTGNPSGGPRPRFSANLDAIARSGLRVNPQVLLLAKTPRVSLP